MAYTGYVKSYIDEEARTTFFIKRYPTFRSEFYDPFANEGDDLPIELLTPRDKLNFADYCKYRFGVIASDLQSLATWKAKIPSYLK